MITGTPDPNWREWDEISARRDSNIRVRLKDEAYGLEEVTVTFPNGETETDIDYDLSLQAKDWCTEHLKGRWYFEKDLGGGYLVCEEVEDAALVKLTWGAPEKTY